MSGALGPPISFALRSLFFSSSSCSIAFLEEVKCCSEANTAKTPLSFLSKSKMKIWSTCPELKCRHVHAVGPFCSPHHLLTVTEASFGVEVGKGEAHTVLVGIAQRGFPFVFSLRPFISFTCNVIDKLTFSLTKERCFGFFRIKYEKMDILASSWAYLLMR